MAGYKFKEGFSVRPFGDQSGVIDNSNLTDGIAEYLLDSGVVNEDVFEQDKPKKASKKSKIQ
jgi:hypothetical protein